jgi:hypothetical protein
VDLHLLKEKKLDRFLLLSQKGNQWRPNEEQRRGYVVGLEKGSSKGEDREKMQQDREMGQKQGQGVGNSKKGGGIGNEEQREQQTWLKKEK